jgi:hypothetical protein
MFSDNGGPPYEPYKLYLQLYEELRKIIDGGNESMTHQDAVEWCRSKADKEYHE